MSLRFDIADLEHAIGSLIAQCPELADDETLRSDMLAGETEIEAVMTKLVRMAQEARHDAAAVAQWAGELSIRKARHEAREQAFRSMIEHLLAKANLPKLTLPEATLTVTTKAPAPIIATPELVPDDFMKVKREPDKTAINQHYKQTGQLPAGCTLSNGGSQLTIRVR
jgi:hypothetical protein